MTPAEVPSGMEGTPQGQLKSFTLRRRTNTWHPPATRASAKVQAIGVRADRWVAYRTIPFRRARRAVCRLPVHSMLVSRIYVRMAHSQ